MALTARVTQGLVLALADHVPALTHWAHCWKMTRRDGVLFAYTDHDRVIPFQGIDYTPSASLQASALELASMLGQAGNMELAGMITDDAITEADLHTGKFDAAEVEVWLVPWANAGGEIARRLARGTTGKLNHGKAAFRMEVLTAGGKLTQRPLIEAVTPSCRFQLGDARCGLSLVAFTVTGSVTAVGSRNAATIAHHRVFRDSARAEADGYFSQGVLTWLTGTNAGSKSEIKSYTSATKEFVLWDPAPEPITLTDQYEAVAGDDKRFSTCQTKFDNTANFGGFPDVPGRDAIAKAPKSK